MVFDDICVYCGDTEVIETDDIRQLREDYGIVRPICYSCKQLRPVKTRNAKKNKKAKVKF